MGPPPDPRDDGTTRCHKEAISENPKSLGGLGAEILLKNSPNITMGGLPGNTYVISFHHFFLFFFAVRVPHQFFDGAIHLHTYKLGGSKKKTLHTECFGG